MWLKEKDLPHWFAWERFPGQQRGLGTFPLSATVGLGTFPLSAAVLGRSLVDRFLGHTLCTLATGGDSELLTDMVARASAGPLARTADTAGLG